jgi:hypothetical protein
LVAKELLKEVLLGQRQRIDKARDEDFVIREKLEEIKRFLKLRHSIIITGIRRCGKSVFLSQIINNFFDNYYYINFEDERLADFELKDFNLLYEVCIELFGKSKTFFLDEVQNVQGWERWVRRMYEDNFKFFITGSNARLLSKELATLLTGRHLQFSIFPFSFKEFLNFYKFHLKKEDLYLTEKRALIGRYFSEYLKNGGFPEYLKYTEIEIPQGYFNDIIQRDIMERYNVKNIKQIKELARYLITNSGNLATYNRLKKITELGINTAIKYLSYLENAYLVFSIPYFSYSLKRQIANPFKVFAIDTGLRNAISFKFSKDVGKDYENIVAVELKRKNKEVFYWKNPQHEEVDFVIKEGRKIKQLIQVCYDISDFNTKNRELKALIKASNDLKCRDLLVITEDYEGEEKIKNKKIKFKPLWKWLLEKD